MMRTDQTLVGDVDEDSDGSSLYLDSHARLSPLLWLATVFKTYDDDQHQTPSIEYISTLFELQSSSLVNLDRPCTSSEHHLFRISNSVHTLCRHKLSLYCYPNKSIDELLTIKDEIMDSINGGTGIDEISLGLAIEYNCSERVLLETCIEIWDQFRSFLRESYKNNTFSEFLDTSFQDPLREINLVKKLPFLTRREMMEDDQEDQVRSRSSTTSGEDDNHSVCTSTTSIESSASLGVYWA
ncbi:hypothetical protein Pst134EA_031815 [Puccinia striiformis f. sp. tritici]|uniref:uncharacterized protein n=1 Tax=Puccinia striiformis f. sp. tritici TaxID=168172 RepID=UPI0020074005|nr:uncharacterized protein Pst134EA_031815 [Puccinia striiformis f. sp. tritici]KAH9442594.1 hypothetical protein Pst134EA_031815 [Puccinia striiformis f. sp. tritici]